MKLKDHLQQANPSDLPALLQKLGVGQLVSTVSRFIYRAAVNQAPVDQIASVHTIKLPDDAKCGTILLAYALAGTGTLGPLTIDAGPMTTATAAGHVNYSNSGDLTFASADAWTKVDITYMPRRLDVVTLTLPVVATTGVCAIPAAISGRIVLLEEATAVSGTVTGACAVIAGSDAVPVTTKQANLNLAKTQVQFKIADAVTSATVKLGLVPLIDQHALLEQDL